MSKIPERVEKAFRALKQEYEHIYLKQLKANYYVYKQTYEWQQDKKISKTVSEYIGKITSEGVFVKRITSYKDEFEKAKALIAEHGGEITWHKGKEKQIQDSTLEKPEIKIKDTDLKILTALSMNSRMPISKLAKFADMGEQAVYSRIKILEERLGFQYMLEMNIEKLGYFMYLILVKFENNMPSTEEIAKTLGDESRVQFAATTKGDYDLIIFVIDEAPIRAFDNLVNLRQKELFNAYRAYWSFTIFAQAFPFMPVRNTFIEKVLKERTWHKSRETPRRTENQLGIAEFAVLNELNTNSSFNFIDIDQKYHLTKGAARYAYHELKENGIIIRPTISLTKIPIKYIGVIIIENIYYKAIMENRHKLLLDELEYGPIVNKFCLLGNIGAPVNGGISFLPVLKEGDLDKASAKIERGLQGSLIKNLIITNIMVGTLCYRRFDTKYSRAHQLLIDMKKLEQTKLIIYD